MRIDRDTVQISRSGTSSVTAIKKRPEEQSDGLFTNNTSLTLWSQKHMGEMEVVSGGCH